MSRFERATDDKLRNAGWLPEWIEADEDEKGPYRVVKNEEAKCNCCGNDRTREYTVISLETCCGISTSWQGEGGDIVASEMCSLLNKVWNDGFENAAFAFTGLRDWR